ncbi:MAG: hydantoinase B/oxoprolinase family protein [Pseudomonadota bacterium]|nr:hydantoinase B/oxoprolinase family protein [Pseudomonadota bacterium]
MGYAETRVITEESIEIDFTEKYFAELRFRIQVLEKETAKKLKEQGIPIIKQSILTTFKMRYLGTDDSIDIELEDFQTMQSLFETQYIKRYGFVEKDKPIIVTSMVSEGLNIPSADQTLSQPHSSDRPTDVSPIGKHKVFLGGKALLLPFYDEDNLTAGTTLDGPLVVISKTNTVLVESSWILEVSNNKALILRKIGKTRAAPEATVTNTPVNIELFSNQVMSIAEQMGVALQKTASSVNIKERLDFSCAIFDEKGDLLANAPHIPVHLGSMSESVKQIINHFGSNLKRAEVYMTNNPFSGGTHLPDITVISPVFLPHFKNSIFFVASRGHHADVGGITPGSMPATSTNINQEGVLIDNLIIVKGGVFQETKIRHSLGRNEYPARNMETNLADIKAKVAANKKGEIALIELVRHYGVNKVRNYVDVVKKQGEESVSKILKTLSPGSFKTILDSGEIIAVKVSINNEKPSITINFEGTSRQSFSNLNAPIAICRASVLYVLRTLVPKDIPLNEGCLRPVNLIIPEGSMLNPVYPAAVVAGNVETSQNIVDCLYAALGRMASSQGTMNNVTFGNDKYQYYETICGGTGAGPGFHGRDAVQSHMTNSRLTDPEILELRFPTIISDFSIRRYSGGSGEYKGGNGVSRKLTFLEDMTVSILSGHRKKGPAGIKGGLNGLSGRNRVIKKEEEVVDLAGIAQFTIKSGETLWIETPGGGGYGKPK